MRAAAAAAAATAAVALGAALAAGLPAWHGPGEGIREAPAAAPAPSTEPSTMRAGSAARPRVGVPAAEPVSAEPGSAAAEPAPLAAGASSVQDGPPYDGGFHFLRIEYESGSSLRGFGRWRGREPPWAHDRPRAERNFLKLLSNLTYVNRGEGRDEWLHLPLDDPELFRYPIAYIVEVGGWRPGDREVRALREYLLKGGFLIVDDFRGRDFFNFQEQMRRVLPEAVLFQLTGERAILPDIRLYRRPGGHEIFDSFFRIANPEGLTPPYGGQPPIYLGVFEDNDPSERLMVVVNFNNDIAEYWEYSDLGHYPIDLENEAYKFGINYVIYGMTH